MGITNFVDKNGCDLVHYFCTLGFYKYKKTDTGYCYETIRDNTLIRVKDMKLQRLMRGKADKYVQASFIYCTLANENRILNKKIDILELMNIIMNVRDSLYQVYGIEILTNSYIGHIVTPNNDEIISLDNCNYLHFIKKVIEVATGDRKIFNKKFLDTMDSIITVKR